MAAHHSGMITQCVVTLSLVFVSKSHINRGNGTPIPPAINVRPEIDARIGFVFDSGEDYSFSGETAREPLDFMRILKNPTLELRVSNSMPFNQERVTFTCTLQPAQVGRLDIRWKKDGQLLDDWPYNSLSHTLTVTPADSGLYSCLSRVESGDVYVTITPVQVIVNSLPLPPITIGGIVASLAVLVIIIVIITCAYLRKRKKDSPVKSLPALPTQRVETATDAYDLPDVTNHIYEEIFEEDVSGHQRSPAISPTMSRYVPTGVPRHPKMAPEDSYYEEVIGHGVTVKPRPPAITPTETGSVAVEPRKTTPEDTDYIEVIGNGRTMGTSVQCEQLNTVAMFNQWMVDNRIDSQTQDKLREHSISTVQDLINLSHTDMIEIGLKVGERNRIKKAAKSLSKRMEL